MRERTRLRSTTSHWLGDFTFFQYNRRPPSLLSNRWRFKAHEKNLARSCNHTRGRVFCLVADKLRPSKDESIGWYLEAGRQQLPKGARNIKIISGRALHFCCLRYEERELLGTGGGTYILNGSSYTEHVDFGDRISAGVVGKDQQLQGKDRWRHIRASRHPVKWKRPVGNLEAG